MQVEYDLVIDFARPSKSNTIIIAEGDANSRYCKFVLLSNKVPFDMIDVSSASVKAVKSDGSVVFGDATIEQDSDGNNTNVLTYLLPSSISNISGKSTLTITLMSTTGAILTSFEFYVQTRNALYSEDDYISSTDLTGFHDLLNKCKAALAKMETMVEKDALPNPYPINITVDGTTSSYTGNEKVDIDFDYLTYINQDDEVSTEDSIDETAAQSAAESATEAKSYMDAAALSATQAAQSAEDIETAVEQAQTSATNASGYAGQALASANTAAALVEGANSKIGTVDISDIGSSITDAIYKLNQKIGS